MSLNNRAIIAGGIGFGARAFTLAGWTPYAAEIVDPPGYLTAAVGPVASLAYQPLMPAEVVFNLEAGAVASVSTETVTSTMVEITVATLASFEASEVAIVDVELEQGPET